MGGMRGNLPRRQPDPKRKPVPQQAQVEGVQQRQRAQGGVPMFHEVEQVELRPNSTVTAFGYRFPTSGVVRMASLRIKNKPKAMLLFISILLDGTVLSRVPWDDMRPLLHFPESLTVDETMSLSIQIERLGGDSVATADVDIAYLFQETARAAVQPDAR